MAISRLAITNLRNLGLLDIVPGQDVNLIIGPNGSGKTSILESIYLLGRARSFVTSRHTSLIRRGQKCCTVYGKIQTGEKAPAVSVGVTRTLDGKQQIKVAGDKVTSSAPLAELLPLQVINPGAFRLLDGGPKSRRQFIDWGVFHVEHTFIDNWRRLNRCLKQRNNLLRQGKFDAGLLSSWDKEFVESANLLTAQREEYVKRLTPLFSELLSRVSKLEKVSLGFYPGWDEKAGLERVLSDSKERDLKEGFTHYGPQRAELKAKYLGLNAAETLSRGQQKLVVCALKIAQGHLYSESRGRPCVYLVDDLAAELDAEHLEVLCQLLSELDCQLFVTSVEEAVFNGCWSAKNTKMFHVEHGRLIE